MSKLVWNKRKYFLYKNRKIYVNLKDVASDSREVVYARGLFSFKRKRLKASNITAASNSLLKLRKIKKQTDDGFLGFLKNKRKGE